MKDPVLARLLRFETGLNAGGTHDAHEVLATYWTKAGVPLFAFCRDGLLLNPGDNERYVAFSEIADGGYYNTENVRRAKAARESGVPSPLTIRLTSGECIDLALEIRDGGMPDLLQIASLIQQRAVVHGAGRG